MSKPHIVLSAGGSGGHVFGAQALAEELSMRDLNVGLVTDPRGERYIKNFPKNVSQNVLSLKNPFGRGIFGFLESIFLIIKSVFWTIRYIRKRKIKMMIGFGGYPTFPTLLASLLCRVPVVIHEQNSVLGRVNKIFAKYAKLLTFGIDPVKAPKGSGDYICIGNPLRKDILNNVNREYLPLVNGQFTILVIGGSQGASFISEIVPIAVQKIKLATGKSIMIYHQSGNQDIDLIKQQYLKGKIKVEIKPFFENIAELMAKSQLIICRAGASTLTELCALGRPSILIPLPGSIGNHQYINAKSLEINGAAKILLQDTISGDLLASTISEYINHPELSRTMAKAAGKLKKLTAASVLADRIISEVLKSEC